MSEKTEILPAQEVVDAMLENVIQPILDDLVEELQVPLSASFYIFVNDEKVRQLPTLYSTSRDSEESVHGEVRLRFRKTFFDSKINYFLDLT